MRGIQAVAVGVDRRQAVEGADHQAGDEDGAQRLRHALPEETHFQRRGDQLGRVHAPGHGQRDQARGEADGDQQQRLVVEGRAQRQQALADEVGSEVTGSLDDLIVNLVSQQWRRPPSARNGMSVEVLIEMLPDGTITNASVSRSSGDKPFDSSAVAAVRNVGRIPEMQQLPRATFDSLYRQRRIIFKPEDLSL